GIPATRSGAVPHHYGKGQSGAPKLLAGFSMGRSRAERLGSLVYIAG
ncbi:hypothetical protein A2U01_0119486, partial [Trifolium medium]|nr:hypothetical protein [Trifolium medium]